MSESKVCHQFDLNSLLNRSKTIFHFSIENDDESKGRRRDEGGLTVLHLRKIFDIHLGQGREREGRRVRDNRGEKSPSSLYLASEYPSPQAFVKNETVSLLGKIFPMLSEGGRTPEYK